jgi:hypothetical protein
MAKTPSPTVNPALATAAMPTDLETRKREKDDLRATIAWVRRQRYLGKALPPETIGQARLYILNKVGRGRRDPRFSTSWSIINRMVVEELALSPGAPNADVSGITQPAAGAQFIERGTIDFKTGAATGKSLREILEPIDDLHELRAYAAAQKSILLEERGASTGIDQGAARMIVEADQTIYEPILSELVDYQDRVIKYLRDAGCLSDAAYTALRGANRLYIPFYRLVEGELRYKRVLDDPVETAIRNTYAYLQLAEAQSARKSPEGHSAEVDVPEEMTPSYAAAFLRIFRISGRVADELYTLASQVQ